MSDVRFLPGRLVHLSPKGASMNPDLDPSITGTIEDVADDWSAAGVVFAIRPGLTLHTTMRAEWLEVLP